MAATEIESNLKEKDPKSDSVMAATEIESNLEEKDPLSDSVKTATEIESNLKEKYLLSDSVMAATEVESNLKEKDPYSDEEGFVDDIKDEELLADLYAKEPTPEIYKERCIIVFGLPIAPKEKVPKLEGILNKVFAIKGCTHYHELPVNEDGTAKGHCFVEYTSKELAEAALLVLNGFKFGNDHILRAYHIPTLDNIKEPDANWEKPKPKEYVDVGDLWWYVKNPKCIDQFAIQVRNRQEDTVSLEIYWANNEKDPSSIEAKSQWSEGIFKWSPYGTYLATVHKQGVLLWAGEKFERCQRVHHESADFIEFSPKESYIVTYSSQVGNHENSLRIYDTFTGECKKSFSPSNQTGVHSWPFFKWSFDEKYVGFCRPKSNNIIIYDTSTFTVNSNKPIEIDSLSAFEWSPTKNMIAYYVEERQSSSLPAEIHIIEFPSRQKVRSQRIFSVSAASLFWQKSGTYLAAHIERFNSIKKNKEGESRLTGVVSHLEIFDLSEKAVATQTMQLSDPFIAFEWEPKGNRFCVLQGSSNKATPVVYRIEKEKQMPQCISKLEAGIQLNTVSWAPQGGWLAVYARNSSAGHVFFIDTNGTEATKTRGIEHPNVNYGSWDPTGRYFVTACLNDSRYDTSYRIHTFQGRELFRKSIETIRRFKWRPRPPVNLPEEKIREIRRNMKTTSKIFEEEDRREQQKMSNERLEERKKVMEEFNKLRTEHQQRREQEKEERIKLRDGFDTDIIDQSDFIEEELTVIVNTEKVEIKKT